MDHNSTSEKKNTYHIFKFMTSCILQREGANVQTVKDVFAGRGGLDDL